MVDGGPVAWQKIEKEMLLRLLGVGGWVFGMYTTTLYTALRVYAILCSKIICYTLLFNLQTYLVGSF